MQKTIDILDVLFKVATAVAAIIEIAKKLQK